MLQCVKILWNVGAFELHSTPTTNISACGIICIMLYMKMILWNFGVSKPHSNCYQNICMHVTNTITIMSKQYTWYNYFNSSINTLPLIHKIESNSQSFISHLSNDPTYYLKNWQSSTNKKNKNYSPFEFYKRIYPHLEQRNRTSFASTCL
jgi:hypothetical protein